MTRYNRYTLCIILVMLLRLLRYILHNIITRPAAVFMWSTVIASTPPVSHLSADGYLQLDPKVSLTVCFLFGYRIFTPTVLSYVL